MFFNAVIEGNTNTVRNLVEQGGDINQTIGQGWTALHIASEQGHLELVQYLVEQGADVNDVPIMARLLFISPVRKGI